MKSKTVIYTIRLPIDLREKLQKQADEEGRTLANYIIYLLTKGVKNG